MNEQEIIIRINKLKGEIKKLESDKKSIQKKIKAARDGMAEAKNAKNKVDNAFSEHQAKLNTKLNSTTSAFSSFYRKQHNDVLKKGDLDKADSNLNSLVSDFKTSILDLEDKTTIVDKKIEIKKNKIIQYQKILKQLESE